MIEHDSFLQTLVDDGIDINDLIPAKDSIYAIAWTTDVLMLAIICYAIGG